ncbi:hypothetical protein RCT43_05530 [Escherichia marmotae]|nr:hypothetical protein [Escherichia marmotae]
MNKQLFLIVVYNKKIAESCTFNKVVNSKFSDDSLCVIWNNGPTSCEEEFLNVYEHNKNIRYHETLHNISLAKIYNEVINKYNAQIYIILDDDSSLTDAYFEAVKQISPNEVGMPVIYYDRKIINPCINGQIYSKGINIDANDTITTIGSGLVVGRDVASQLFKAYNSVFDERFYLYGVDTTFCFRLNKLKINDKIKIIDGFEHGLSRLEGKNDKLTLFRKIERSNDLALQIRYYKEKKHWFLMMVLLLASSIKKFITFQPQQYKYSTIIKTFVKGKHERQR